MDDGATRKMSYGHGDEVSRHDTGPTDGPGTWLRCYVLFPKTISMVAGIRRRRVPRETGEWSEGQCRRASRELIHQPSPPIWLCPLENWPSSSVRRLLYSQLRPAADARLGTAPVEGVTCGRISAPMSGTAARVFTAGQSAQVLSAPGGPPIIVQSSLK
jgi:hypothetical protein